MYIGNDPRRAVILHPVTIDGEKEFEVFVFGKYEGNCDTRESAYSFGFNIVNKIYYGKGKKL